MGVLISPFSWSFGVSNLSGTPPAATVGTNFTAGASNADGSSVGVISALSKDVHYLVIGIGGITASNADSNSLLDVLIDPAGGTSWSSFIDNLVCGFSGVPAAGTVSLTSWYHFPIFIKSGSALGVRARTARTTSITTGRVVMYCFGNPNRHDHWWCGQKVESLGISEASSKGTNITPGNSGANGSWTTIGTSTASYGAVQFGVNGSDSSMTAIGYYWRIGFGSAQMPGSPVFYSSNATSEQSARTGFICPIWCDVPSGTTWQAMGTASGTAEVHNVAIYGVY